MLIDVNDDQYRDNDDQHFDNDNQHCDNCDQMKIKNVNQPTTIHFTEDVCHQLFSVSWSDRNI